MVMEVLPVTVLLLVECEPCVNIFVVPTDNELDVVEAVVNGLKARPGSYSLKRASVVPSRRALPCA